MVDISRRLLPAESAKLRPSSDTYTGHWYIKRSSDGVMVDKYWGLGTDVPVPADYDGDGKADIAVWRGSDTNWYISRSTGGVQIQQFGLANDVPLPGAFVP